MIRTAGKTVFIAGGFFRGWQFDVIPLAYTVSAFCGWSREYGAAAYNFFSYRTSGLCSKLQRKTPRGDPAQAHPAPLFFPFTKTAHKSIMIANSR